MTKWITHWTIAFVTAACMLAIHYGDSTIVPNSSLKQFHPFANIRSCSNPSDIAVVAIDETAIEKYGQWS